MNPDDFASHSPSLPHSILYPATMMFIFVQMIVFWRVNDRVANFVIFAIWFRYVLDAYPFVTYKPLFAGLSLIAFCSGGIIALGLVVIKPRDLLKRHLVPCYMLIGVVIVSGLVNSTPGGIISVALKYSYFIVVTLAVFESLERLGERFLSVILWAFLPPLVLQALSIILGIHTAAENYTAAEEGGSNSFIGGYNHEANFSIILATCFIVACMSTAVRGIIKSGLLLISLVGIYFANYRTTMIAIAPMAMAQFTAGISGRFIRDQRAIVAAGAFVIGLAGVIGVSWFLQQRFQDVTTVAESRGLMIKPPAEFSVAEGKTLSGRSYIWSSYLYAYLRGSDVQHVIGFGPETRALTKYAHNTLISYLYEYGVVGVILIIYWWAAMFVAGLRIVLGPKVRLLAAHVSFILLNMGTMPLWMIEGNILYGILCGYTLYLLKNSQSLGQIPSRRRAITLKQSSAKNSGVAARVQREIQQVVDQVGGSGSG